MGVVTVSIVLVFSLVVGCVYAQDAPKISSYTATILAQYQGAVAKYQLYYDYGSDENGVDRRLRADNQNNRITQIMLQGEQTSVLYDPVTSNCTFNCNDGGVCPPDPSERCGFAFLNIFEFLPIANKTTATCGSNSNNVLWSASYANMTVLYCFSDQIPLSVELKDEIGGSLILVAFDNFVSGEPADSVFDIPKYCDCSKQHLAATAEFPISPSLFEIKRKVLGHFRELY